MLLPCGRGVSGYTESKMGESGPIFGRETKVMQSWKSKLWGKEKLGELNLNKMFTYQYYESLSFPSADLSNYHSYLIGTLILSVNLWLQLRLQCLKGLAKISGKLRLQGFFVRNLEWRLIWRPVRQVRFKKLWGMEEE